MFGYATIVTAVSHRHRWCLTVRRCTLVVFPRKPQVLYFPAQRQCWNQFWTNSHGNEAQRFPYTRNILSRPLFTVTSLLYAFWSSSSIGHLKPCFTRILDDQFSPWCVPYFIATGTSQCHSWLGRHDGPKVGVATPSDSYASINFPTTSTPLSQVSNVTYTLPRDSPFFKIMSFIIYLLIQS